MLRLLRTTQPRVSIAASLRMAEVESIASQPASPQRFLVEIGGMSCPAMQSALDGFTPSLVLLLRVPSGDEAACSRFARQLRPGGALLICGDDAGAMAVANAVASHENLSTSVDVAPRALITFGVGDSNDWRAVNITSSESGTSFDVSIRRRGLIRDARVTLPEPAHNEDICACLGAMLATTLLDAGVAHASAGGDPDMVSTAVDVPLLQASAAKVAAAMNNSML